MADDTTREGNGDSRKARCEKVIHWAAATAAAGGGLTLVPGSDAVVIMPVQVLMVAQLARIHEVPLSRSLARSAAYATLGQILGRGSTRLLASWIPGIGNVIRAGVAFGITEAIGWAVVEQLERGDLG